MLVRSWWSGPTFLYSGSISADLRISSIVLDIIDSSKDVYCSSSQVMKCNEKTHGVKLKPRG